MSRSKQEAKYLAIRDTYQEKGWSIRWMCKVLGISRAAYYKWLRRKPTEEEIENQQIMEWILEYSEKYGYTLGYRRMRNHINRDKDKNYSRNRIHRLMRAMGIRAVIRKPRRRYKPAVAEAAAENLLKRDFTATRPNEKWTADVTEFKIPMSAEKLYLSAILDLYDRSVISYSVSKRNDNALVFETYDRAIAENPDAKPLFHSDRGYQYTNGVFRRKLQEQGIEQSMSRTGCCIDNGPTEGLWGIIKSEMYCMYEVKDETSLRNAIDQYIDYYNHYRYQERFQCLAPAEVRQAAFHSDEPQQYPIPENKRIKAYWKRLEQKKTA